MTRQLFLLKNAGGYQLVKSAVIAIIGFLSILIASGFIMDQSVHAKETPRINIIDGLTYADTCLYMLESTRQLEQPDCDTLKTWHKESFPLLPDAKNIDSAQRAKFERNLKLYRSTLRGVRQILNSEVTGQ